MLIELPQHDAPTQGTCSLCGKVCDQDAYCFGCKCFICEDCDQESPMGFGHQPTDHQSTSGCALLGMLLVLLMFWCWVLSY